MKRFLICLIGGGAIFLVLVRPESAQGEDDFQYWSTYEWSKRLTDTLEVLYNPSFRLRDDASDFFYHEHRQGVRWKAWQHVQIGAYYLFARNQGTRGAPRDEHRGELDLAPKFGWRGAEFSLRQRTELRQVEGSSGEAEWRFRMMPRVAYKLTFGKLSFTPYVANDLFYEAKNDAWNQNRLYIGVSIPLRKMGGVTPLAEVFYMLKHDRSVWDEWSASHVLGTKCTIRL